MADIKSFPNNSSTYQGAEEFMRWFHGRTSGIWADGGGCVVTPVTSTMKVKLTDGGGWLSNADSNGIVWWNDEFASNGSYLELTVPAAHATLDRIDRVVVTWSTTNYAALPTISILQGTASASPVAPALTNDTTQRQISLARIRVNAGTTAITSDMITDERLDPTVCGTTTFPANIDTTAMNAQYQAMIAELDRLREEFISENVYEIQKLIFSGLYISTSSWAADATYEDYPYRAAITASGVTSAMIPEVIFAPNSESLAPVADAGTNCVYVYAASAPVDTISVPTMIVWTGV